MQQPHCAKLLRRRQALLRYTGRFRLLLCISAFLSRLGLLQLAKQGSQVIVRLLLLLLLLQLLLSPKCLPTACGSRLQDGPACSRSVPATRDTLHVQPFHQVQQQAEASLRSASMPSSTHSVRYAACSTWAQSAASSSEVPLNT